MTREQKRLVRLHRRALRAWTARQGYGLDAMPRALRILQLHALIPSREPGDSYGAVYSWWN